MVDDGTIAPAEDDVLPAILVAGATITAGPTVRLGRVLNALCDATGATLCAATCCDDMAPGRIPRIVGVIEAGSLGDEARAVYLRYLNDAHAGDPFFDAFAMRLLAQPSPFALQTHLREDFVPDAVWYGSKHVREYRQTAGVDSCIYSVVSANEPHRIWSMGLHRPWGAERFGDKERDLVCRLHSALTPLMQQCWGDEDEYGNALAQLPLRLQRTLMCLLEGQSEKQIASRLGLTPHTVHDYVKQIHKRLGVTSRAELIIKCLGPGAHRYSIGETQPPNA